MRQRHFLNRGVHIPPANFTILRTLSPATMDEVPTCQQTSPFQSTKCLLPGAFGIEDAHEDCCTDTLLQSASRKAHHPVSARGLSLSRDAVLQVFGWIGVPSLPAARRVSSRCYVAVHALLSQEPTLSSELHLCLED